jgi:hypothetical protein
MTETSGPTLRRWLIVAVDDLGGARRAEVHSRVEHLFGEQFTAQDRLPRTGRAGNEPAWRNNLDSLYDRLKKAGFMVDGPARSPWRLTANGEAEAQVYRPETQSVAVDTLLENFKPKDASDYLARVRDRILVKQREHENLLSRFGYAISRAGWRPRTSVHPRDLELQRASTKCLVEIKMVYSGDATRAVREALAQLLEYRYFFYDESPHLLAVFSEQVGDAYLGLLREHDVATVWRSGSGWTGTPEAYRHSLVPPTVK